MDIRDTGDIGEIGENDPSDSECANQAYEPHKAWFGATLEAAASLGVILWMLTVLMVVFGGPAWLWVLGLLFVAVGARWELFVGGLLLTIWPRMMAGTRIERLWLASRGPRRVAGLLLALSGICLVTFLLLAWAGEAGVMSVKRPSWLLAALVIIGIAPCLLLTLMIPRRGRRRGAQQRVEPSVGRNSGPGPRPPREETGRT